MLAYKLMRKRNSMLICLARTLILALIGLLEVEAPNQEEDIPSKP
jgi:hypothetical protein